MPEASFKKYLNDIPIPKHVIEDYEEACKIKNLSPKAAATLARRCLQSMIRDFVSVSGKNLYDEITAIKDKIDPIVWEAIRKIREYGNIGAHTKKNTSEIIEIKEDEAGRLVWLIEFLIEKWYIQKYNENKRLREVKSLTTKRP